LLSLVAVRDNAVVGHILFSPAILRSGQVEVPGMGLAPMAVAPDHQRQGIGSQLVRAGLERLRTQVKGIIDVLGQRWSLVAHETRGGGLHQRGVDQKRQLLDAIRQGAS